MRWRGPDGRVVLFAAMLASSLAAPSPAADDPPLPRPRPEAAATPDAPPLPKPRPADSSSPLAVSVETPEAAVYQSACPAVFAGTVVATMLPPIDDGTCAVRSPLLVTAVVAGGREIGFSAPATVGCALAGQLAEWVARVDAYTTIQHKSPVAEVLVGTSYDCRPRNNEAGGRVSEHGFADAVDIVGFRLADGTRLSLPEDWAGDGTEAQSLRFAHDAACGLFTTVLGPDANALHRDHLHLDLGCHGRSCTYRLCQ